MNEVPSCVTVIPAKPELLRKKEQLRQIRVAAYCRVSTDDEEQLTSYEAQKNYYTNKIITHPDWIMAGIYADEGITGTSARKRPEFLRMIRQCRQKKIDVILTKSISRFARNTVDCLSYIRSLRAMGIAVIFEKENINTLEIDSEMLITLLGAFAQAESESISANVRWGKRQAMREGRVIIQYHNLYAYEKGADGRPQIIPEQAEVVKSIYKMFLSGASLKAIQEHMNTLNTPNLRGKTTWTLQNVISILTNEKYCGDVLMQKSYIADCISKKKVKNTGQLPMYLIQNHHEGIISRDTFDAVQAERARRAALKSPSKKYAHTGRGGYSSKYSLTERLVCGECGTPYRRCTWSRNGKKRIVWRCVSRLDYGIKYCRHSPSMDEGQLQQAIMNAINSAISKDQSIVCSLDLEQCPVSSENISLTDVDRRMSALNDLTREIIEKASRNHDASAYTEQLKALMEEAAELKKKKAVLEQQDTENHQPVGTYESPEQTTPYITKWDDNLIRKFVKTVTVVSASKIIVTLYHGTEIEQEVEK